MGTGLAFRLKQMTVNPDDKKTQMCSTKLSGTGHPLGYTANTIEPRRQTGKPSKKGSNEAPYTDVGHTTRPLGQTTNTTVLR